MEFIDYRKKKRKSSPGQKISTTKIERVEERENGETNAKEKRKREKEEEKEKKDRKKEHTEQSSSLLTFFLLSSERRQEPGELSAFGFPLHRLLFDRFRRLSS